MEKTEYTPEEIAKAFEIAGGKEKVRDLLLSARYQAKLAELSRGTVEDLLNAGKEDKEFAAWIKPMKLRAIVDAAPPKKERTRKAGPKAVLTDDQYELSKTAILKVLKGKTAENHDDCTATALKDNPKANPANLASFSPVLKKMAKEGLIVTEGKGKGPNAVAYLLK